MELVIAIDGTGAVEALHMDAFDLGFLGDKQVARQTEIAFSSASQKWDIIYINADGFTTHSKSLQGFDGYETARAFEVDWVNKCRLYSIPPDSNVGIAYAHWLRYCSPSSCFTLPNGECISEGCGCLHATA